MARLAEVVNFSHGFLGSMVNLCQPANLFSIKWYIGKGRMVSARGRVRARERVSAYAHEGFEPRLAVGRLAGNPRSARTREALVLHFGAYDSVGQD